MLMQLKVKKVATCAVFTNNIVRKMRRKYGALRSYACHSFKICARRLREKSLDSSIHGNFSQLTSCSWEQLMLLRSGFQKGSSWMSKFPERPNFRVLLLRVLAQRQTYLSSAFCSNVKNELISHGGKTTETSLRRHIRLMWPPVQLKHSFRTAWLITTCNAQVLDSLKTTSCTESEYKSVS